VNTTLGSGVHQNDLTRTTMNSSGGKRKSGNVKKKRPSKIIEQGIDAEDERFSP